MSRPSEKLFVFGERLEMRKKETGFLQWRLANALGVERKAVSNWIRGVNTPDAVIVKWLAVYFNVRADWLLGIISERRKVNYDRCLLPDAKSLQGQGYRRKHRCLPILAERLNEVLAYRKMSKEALADRLGRDRKTVYRWVNGKSIPNAYMLRELATFFHVSADWLLGLSDRVDGELQR